MCQNLRQLSGIAQRLARITTMDSIKKNTISVWGATPAGAAFAMGLTPGSKEYFEKSYKLRSEYEMPWLTEIFPFPTSKGKKVLEIGCGAGYDAFEFCRNGAEYHGVDLTPENTQRTRSHLSFYNFNPEILVGDAESLQFDDNNFDLVFSNGVLHHTPDISQAFTEVHRVLKPNGEFWLTLYNKNSFFYWIYIVLCEQWLRGGYKKRSIQERLGMIEYTTSSELPLVNVYTKTEIKKLLTATGFTIRQIKIRKFVIDDLPKRLRSLPIPTNLLNAIGKFCGWYLVIRASKLTR